MHIICIGCIRDRRVQPNQPVFQQTRLSEEITDSLSEEITEAAQHCQIHKYGSQAAISSSMPRKAKLTSK